MKNFEKTYTVEGSSGEHTIKVSTGDGKIKIHCDCEAGIHKRLCKHVIQLVTTDAELSPFLADAHLDVAFDNLFYAQDDIKRLQDEARKTKSKIEKAIF